MDKHNKEFIIAEVEIEKIKCHIYSLEAKNILLLCNIRPTLQ